MVRRIGIIKNLDDIKESHIVNFEDYCKGDNGVSQDIICDDLTTNFEDLGYWDSDKDMDRKKVKDVITRLIEIIKKMYKEGIKARVWTYKDKESFFLPSWMWGHSETRNPNGTPIKLPDEERKSILLFHLEDLLTICNSECGDNYFYLE